MSKKRLVVSLVVFLTLMAVLIVGICLTGSDGSHGEINETMKDAVLHEYDKIDLGFALVNPAVVSALVVTAVVFVFALVVRLFVIPRFKEVPGKFQLLLESWVGFFDDLAVSNSPHKNKFLGAYIFGAGSYIFIGTIFELFGIQAVTVEGASVALPAPLSDINGALAMGCLSYLVIMSGGVIHNGIKGFLLTLKDFSLPISMSFRLFGALLSGLLVTELVYHYLALSFVLPVIVGVLFTCLHAIIQTYVLVMLTSLFYGEVSEKHPKKPKKSKKIVKLEEAQQ
ncbi:MAG TPA: F0F1 ATP synthase subunit A [Candidatus Limihabitans stercoravium]|nr:F0F1 ATP synthase subunit A [Candidatus Limihabitans stercoravium]